MQTHPESVAPKSNRSWHLKVVMSSNPRVLGGKERRFQRFELVKCGMPSRTLGTCAAASVGQGAEEWGHILQLQITHGNHTNMSKLNKQQTKWDVKPVTYTIFYIQYIYIWMHLVVYPTHSNSASAPGSQAAPVPRMHFRNLKDRPSCSRTSLGPANLA